MNNTDPVLVEADAGVVTITLNRPRALNALDHPMALSLHAAIEQAAALPATRVLVLRGAGASFCGGGDVAAMHAHRDDLPAFIDRMIEAFHRSVMAMNRLPFPVIACVQGAVAGGGISLALACDLVLAARSTRFVVAYPRLGAPADGGLTFRLTQRLGAVRALETLTARGPMTADTALSLGLVNRIVDDDGLVPEGCAWAQELAALPESSVNELKQLVAVQSHDALQAHLAREKAAFLRCAATADFAARVAAFVGKQRDVA